MKRPRFTIEQKLFTGLTVSAVIVIFISVISFSGFRRLINANDWVEQSEHIENHLDHIYNFIIEIESNDRGFLLSGQDI